MSLLEVFRKAMKSKPATKERARSNYVATEGIIKKLEELSQQIQSAKGTLPDNRIDQFMRRIEDMFSEILGVVQEGGGRKGFMNEAREKKVDPIEVLITRQNVVMQATGVRPSADLKSEVETRKALATELKVRLAEIRAKADLVVA